MGPGKRRAQCLILGHYTVSHVRTLYLEDKENEITLLVVYYSSDTLLFSETGSLSPDCENSLYSPGL